MEHFLHINIGASRISLIFYSTKPGFCIRVSSSLQGIPHPVCSRSEGDDDTTAIFRPKLYPFTMSFLLRILFFLVFDGSQSGASSGFLVASLHTTGVPLVIGFANNASRSSQQREAVYIYTASEEAA